MLWLFLGGIVSVNLFSRSGKIVSVDFTSLFPIANPYNQIREKRVLMLYENLNVYQHNSLGGYFLDWELSSPLFTDLSKYDHIEMISSCFKEDPPEVIIDKNNMMEGVIQRIPAIGLAYRKDGNIYRRISN